MWFPVYRRQRRVCSGSLLLCKHLKILLHSLYTRTIRRLFVCACACLCAFKAMVLKPGSSGLVGKKLRLVILKLNANPSLPFYVVVVVVFFFHMLYFSLPKMKRFKAHLDISTQEGFCCCDLNLTLNSSRHIFLSLHLLMLFELRVQRLLHTVFLNSVFNIV